MAGLRLPLSFCLAHARIRRSKLGHKVTNYYMHIIPQHTDHMLPHVGIQPQICEESPGNAKTLPLMPLIPAVEN